VTAVANDYDGPIIEDITEEEHQRDEAEEVEIRRLRPVVSTTFSGLGLRILERNLLLTETAATAKVNQTQCTLGVIDGRR
jgi:hypothetical protein